jgi:hypothetical protein
MAIQRRTFILTLLSTTVLSATQIVSAKGRMVGVLKIVEPGVLHLRFNEVLPRVHIPGLEGIHT